MKLTIKEDFHCGTHYFRFLITKSHHLERNMTLAVDRRAAGAWYVIISAIDVIDTAIYQWNPPSMSFINQTRHRRHSSFDPSIDVINQSNPPLKSYNHYNPPFTSVHQSNPPLTSLINRNPPLTSLRTI